MEYADGGTLAQMLARSQNLLEEEQIVDMMIQMCSAVAYLHENSVLHSSTTLFFRDLKTANVFLTRDSFVKIEMCSGVSYNEKSDMWALGCILYEMCCLKKAFEGDNLPALVNSIMTCAYTPVKGPYSSEMKMVIRELLQLDPQNRPSAAQALKMLRPSENRHRHTSGSMRSSISFTTLYDLHVPTITLSSISDLPGRISIKQISLSKTHTMVLTNDNELFAFGDNSCGQLGFGTFTKKENGKLVESLKGRDIQSIGVGNYFSVICCDRGTLMTIGTAKNLGLGKEAKDSAKPVLLEQLLRENIKDIYCGHDHVIAVLESGECLGWGSNQEEFEHAEVIPIDASKRRVRFDDSCDKLKMDSTAKRNSLMREIEELKSKIKEQDTTFEGHRNQMSDLESKLQELQAKQAFLRKSEPPPAYDRRNVTYNKLFPERENTSTTCVIL
ncbi:hypothetical protein CAEBREN_32302 [Caenorhabditis brenneri]|uniref:non-specific serine/threonine protein kinase n=1 Tax=Caenorhabditis brenneri TaxID=135651 RepID=G0PNU4_CAEBE|nr:hypothetical protein CAEBREN_32302 [Caenorhabditis brenneri]